jgi:hypothetical protein
MSMQLHQMANLMSMQLHQMANIMSTQLHKMANLISMQQHQMANIISVLASPFLQGARPCPSDALPFFSICSSALPFVTNVDVFFHTCC